MNETKRELLRELLGAVLGNGAYPEVQPFRLSHEGLRGDIDELQQEGFVEVESGRYVLTLEGVRACGTDEARAEVDAAANTIPVLQNAYRRDPTRQITAADLSREAGRTEQDVKRAFTLLRHLRILSGFTRDQQTGLVTALTLIENVLDVSPSDVAPPETDLGEQGQADRLLVRIEIDGYRAFRGFTAEPGNLTVIIGANATGKSSLFDFLRFVSQGVESPLPPEIDARSVGKTLFHVGGPERISWGFTLDMGQRVPLRYEAEILGPIGSPRVTRERLATAKPIHDSESKPFIFLDFNAGRGVVQDQREKRLVRPEWTVKPNELALRRALDPTLVTLSRVQNAIAGWRFYSGFDLATAASSPMRRPVPTEPEPMLQEDGSNLSAMLMWLKSDHQEVWEELESMLRSAVPGFHSLNVKPRGGPGTVVAVWREADVADELTLADLSDGTLRLLCWAVLCLAPNPPKLMCLDEPELGLHPRVLPILAGLLRMASARTQILVATHSPYFLSSFSLDEIAVMRKEDGAAHLLRPATSRALRTMVEEIGAEALVRLHLSDELEVLP